MGNTICIVWAIGCVNIILNVFVLAVVHDVQKSVGAALFRQQFKAMLFKRILFTLRNKALTLSQVLMPLFFTILVVVISKVLASETDGIDPLMPLSIDGFGKTKVTNSAIYLQTSKRTMSYVLPPLACHICIILSHLHL